VSSNKITGVIHEREGLAIFWSWSVISATMKLQPFDKKMRDQVMSCMVYSRIQKQGYWIVQFDVLTKY
jgi:hypothetical protein